MKISENRMRSSKLLSSPPPRHVFGSLCGSNLRDPVLFADSTGQQIAFPVGRQLALRHVENNETSFLTTSERHGMQNSHKVERKEHM